ncbi:MAG: AIR synthase family protein [Chloroflexi bacterium]|nr:AIR synthase family protein [Chloroflexota bacterium]
MSDRLPMGKLPNALLARLLAQAPVSDPRLVLGPGVGLDCAVIDDGPQLLVLKTDPITFAAEEIGWYLVQVNANDIATSGARPEWLMVVMLLPEKGTTTELVEQITAQVQRACRELDIALVGGHSEITRGLDRPILVGTMLGKVEWEQLVTPRGAQPGDRILLTKAVPIEATAILAREFPERVRLLLGESGLERARGFLYDPGISVLREARLALQAGRVTAMHDPTEGGLITALWELAQAGGRSLLVDLDRVPIPLISGEICLEFGVDPLAAIASGSLLLTASPGEAAKIRRAIAAQGIACTDIGKVEAGEPSVWRKTKTGRRGVSPPARDEIARVFEELTE